MEFNNIGLGVEDFESDQHAALYHQPAVQHHPECLDPYQLFDQCNCQPTHNAYTSQPATQPPIAGYSMHEQGNRMAAQRTYAQVVSTPPVMHASLYNGHSTFDLSNQQQTFTYPVPIHNAHNTEHIDLAQAGQKRTYAQAVQQGNQVQRSQYGMNFEQHLHPMHVSQSHMRLDHRNNVHGGKIRRKRCLLDPVTSQPVQYTNRSIDRTGYQPQYNNNLSQVQQGVPILQIPAAQPRNVADFVQGTTFGGHRQPPPSSFNNHEDVSSPLSSGALSVASSSASRHSNRRKGMELQDPSLPHRCIECNNTFPRLEDLNRHVNRSHESVANRPYPCDIPGCPWAFVNPKDLRRHQCTHNTYKHRFKCNYEGCEKSYTRTDNLMRHYNRDHVQDSAYLSFDMSRTVSETSFGVEG